MAGLTSDQVITLRSNAYNRTLASYAIAIFGMLANTGLVIAFGPGSAVSVKLLLLISSGAASLFTALALPVIWAELEALRQNKADGLKDTAYEAYVDKLPYAMYGQLAVGAAVLSFVVALWVLFG